MISDPGIYPRDSSLLDYGWIFRGTPHVQRLRVTTVQINAAGGYEMLPARPNIKWRLLDAALIAIGGAAAGATDVRVLGTLIGAGSAAVVMLADGASFTPNDVNTPVVLTKTGATLTGCTNVDVLIWYIDDAA